MKKYKKVLKNEISDVICDVCSRSCLKSPGVPYSSEFASLNAEWGYWSRKDGQNASLDLCEDCFDKIISFVKTISENSSLE